MPQGYLKDDGYVLGMIRDDASWKLPNGALYDSLNCVYDKVGIVRQRMGTTALVSGAQTAFCTSLGFVYSQDSASSIEELYGVSGKSGVVSSINKTNGAATTINTLNVTAAIVGRPARHFGFTVFPWSDTGAATPRQHAAVAGQTTSTTFTNAASAQVAANKQQITLTGADVTTNVKIGGIVTITDTAQTTVYLGRVVSVDTTKLFTVWPKPTWTNAALSIGSITISPANGYISGSVAATFQNRLLVGNAIDISTTTTTTVGLVQDRRVYYSPLPTEETLIMTDPAATGSLNGYTARGANFLNPVYWPFLNYFTIPGSEPLVAMEPLSDNALLILTSNQPVILDGNLATQLATTSPTITFDESSIMRPAGCLSDLSVQRTPRGIIWAGVGGIYAYNGGREIGDLTAKRINSYWRNLTTDATFVVHGSAYVRNHYVISGTSGGTTFSLACDMTNLQWTRLSGAGTDLFLGVARPTNPAQVFAARWWAQSGAAPSMTNGQTVRLESMLSPYTAGATTTDSDGAAVPVLAQTRTITGDPEVQKTFLRGVVEYQQASTTAAVAVTAQSTIDAADVDASRTRTLGSLSNTGTLTITNATNANPIVVTTSTVHGLQTDDFVDIDGVLGNLNANGHYRIAVINTTSFSLVGQIGSAAYTSGGKVKKFTEQGFQMSPLNRGQGASLTFSGSPNNFELHGVKLVVLQQPPVPA